MLIKSQHLLFLLILTSVFYMAKLTQFSPVYIFQPVLSSLLLLMLVRDNNKVSVAGLILSMLVAAYFLLNTVLFSNSYSTYINFFCGIFSFYTIVSLYRYFSIATILNAIINSAKYIVVILVVDSLYRILNPAMPTSEALEAVQGTEYAFYMYKFSTVMFADSNTVAIVCVSLFFLLDYCSKRFFVNTTILRLIILVILLSCLSRSAIFSVIISMFLLNKKLSLRGKLVFLMGVLFPAAFYILSSFFNDGSFVSKLFILQAFFHYLSDADLSYLLLGVGLGNSPLYLNNIYSHIHIVTSIVEGGLIGSLLIIVFLLYYLNLSKYHGLYVVLPNIILGFSYFFYLGAPFVFVPMALIVMLELRLSKIEC